MCQLKSRGIFFVGGGAVAIFCGGGNVPWNFFLMGKAPPLWFRPPSHPLSQKCLKTFLPWANSSQGPVGEKSQRQWRNKGQPRQELPVPFVAHHHYQKPKLTGGWGREIIAHSRQVRAAGCPPRQWLQLSASLVTDQKQGSTTFSEAWLTLVHPLTSD